FILFISTLKAYLFYLVIRLVSTLNLSRPFNNDVANLITKNSYLIFSIGLISYVARQIVKSFQHQGINTAPVNTFCAYSQAYILMAAVVYVIATIFSRGVEIQNENDLTV